MATLDLYDVVVVGGGPAGAIAAERLALAGRRTLLLDRGGRIKPCGGAVPPRLVREFAIPERLVVARATAARIVSPAGVVVTMPIEGGYVGMVDRCTFDEALRERAQRAGAERRTGTFTALAPEADGTTRLAYAPADGDRTVMVRARAVIGADGAQSAVGRAAIGGVAGRRAVFAYHEIVCTPGRAGSTGAAEVVCDIFYGGRLSPDFYAWTFPHGDTTSVGSGSARKGFGLRPAVGEARLLSGLLSAETLRREGAPIPMTPLRRWDDGRNVVLVGDAAGVVAPASGEGIYYAMVTGAAAAGAVDRFLATGRAGHLASVRRTFMRDHGQVFRSLAMLQRFWYTNDATREAFVKLCGDPIIQRLVWDAYMNKRMAKIPMRDLLHVLGRNVTNLAQLWRHALWAQLVTLAQPKPSITEDDFRAEVSKPG